MGYRTSISLNVVLEEVRDPPLYIHNKFLCHNFLSRAVTLTDHPVWSLLEEVQLDTENPTYINRVGTFPLIVLFQSMEAVIRLLLSKNQPLCYAYSFEALMERPMMDIWSGEDLRDSKNIIDNFHKIFDKELSFSQCLFTDGSKMKGALFMGLAVPSLGGTYNRRYRAAGFLSAYCAETMAILLVLDLVLENRWPNVIFSDSRAALTAIGAQFDSRRNSYIILHIKSVLLQLGREGIKIRLIWIPGHWGILGH